MPEVHFVGEIESAAISNYPSSLSLTWAVVPGSAAWFLRGGVSFGETHVGVSSLKDWTHFNYPLDCYYEAFSTEGWPFLVCEVWDKSNEGVRNFVGCGCIWLPSSGSHKLDVNIWKPSSLGLESLSEIFLPTCPDLRALRELVVSPYLRSQIEADSMGTVKVSITAVSSGFDGHGVTIGVHKEEGMRSCLVR